MPPSCADYDPVGERPLFDLNGRVAVVTRRMGQPGGGVGGRARGADARHDPRSRDSAARRGRRVRDSLEEGTIRVHECDFTDRGAVEAALGLLEVDWSAPHIFVNAAAIHAPPGAPSNDGLPPYELDTLVGLPLARALAEDEAILAADVVRTAAAAATR